MTLDLLSVHVPKCAGTSLRKALVGAYGRDRVRLEYDDRPDDPNSPMNAAPEQFLAEFAAERCAKLEGKQVVHGHFNVRKYDGVAANARVTVLREPVSRLASHYSYWMYSLPKSKNSLHEWVRTEKPSLPAFAEIPQLRWFYTRVFFRDVDMSGFDIIGDYSLLPEFEQSVAECLGRPLALESVNVNLTPEYEALTAELSQDEATLARLRELLADDIRFYERHSPLKRA